MPLSKEQVLRLATHTIAVEMQELQKLQDRIDDRFFSAVETIYHCKGRLVIVGIGKSAHIGKKIVATLNSTGTRAQFLHAAEAIHGDLGLISPEDVVLCISHSGNSAEILAILPFLKKYGHSLIGMTGNPNSKLAEAADILLNTQIDQEACPNNLAPTSSTTVQLVLGDALAVALMEMRTFKPQDFAKYHPGGQLGKNLTATVANFLSATKPMVSPTASIREVIISISTSRHGVTAVCENEAVVGVITDGDLRRMLLREVDLDTLKARDIMSVHPKTIAADDLATMALQVLKNHNIGQLVVLQEGRYAGIVDLHSLLSAGIRI